MEGIKFDTHVHTNHSLCSLLKPEEIPRLAAEAGLHTIVITDHNQMKGALKAKKEQELNQHRIKINSCEYGQPLTIELGIELKTEYGEVGVCFLTEHELNVFAGLVNTSGYAAFNDIIEKKQKFRQEGSRMLLCQNHPFSKSRFNRRGGFDFEKLCGTYPTELYDEKIAEAVEVFDFTEQNANNWKLIENTLVRDYAATYELTIVCSTDAHFKGQIGRYYTTGYENTARDSIMKNNLSIPEPQEINYWLSKMYRNRSGMFVKPAKRTIKSIKNLFKKNA